MQLCGALAVQKWNSSLKIEALEKRVGDDSEDYFDDNFWLTQHREVPLQPCPGQKEDWCVLCCNILLGPSYIFVWSHQ